jgi:hypothetical protein
MAGEQKTEKKNRHQHRCEQRPDRKIELPFQQAVNRKADDTADAVVNRPYGNKIIARFSFVRISATRTPIERSEPIAEFAHAPPWDKDRAYPAGRTAKPHRAAEIAPGGGRCARLLHGSKIRPEHLGAKAGYLS